MKKHSEIIEEIYESMCDMHDLGLVDEAQWDKMESMYDSYNAPTYSPSMVKQLRQRMDLTQDGLAAILNTSVSSVRQWEQGIATPGGPSCKLLHLLDKNGLQAMR
jgi:putative transcriptional regulator